MLLPRKLALLPVERRLTSVAQHGMARNVVKYVPRLQRCLKIIELQGYSLTSGFNKDLLSSQISRVHLMSERSPCVW
jgi:hypothetical protein